MSHGSRLAEAAVLLPIAAAGVAYARGTWLAWARAGRGRGVPTAAAACFVAGMATLLVALVGPVDRAGAELFSAHMLQHMLLMNVAAPLLVLGAPIPTMLRAVSPASRAGLVAAAHARSWRAIWTFLTGATVATGLQLAVTAAWHLRGPLVASLHDEVLHAAMHASLLAAALLFWTMVLDAGRTPRWRGVIALLLTAKVMALACLVMLFSDAVAYPGYGPEVRAWGLTASDDEQAGWGLMMIVAGPAYFLAAAALAMQAIFGRRAAGLLVTR